MRRSRGFTLAELAIAFVIIALLLAGAIIPLSTQIEVRNIADTRRTIDQTREALIGYAQVNGRLPCPASGTIATGVANAGTEQYTSPSCTATAGVVPWATLGVPETDAWGRRFSYRVDGNFADAVSQNSFGVGCAPTPTPTQSSFALCSVGTLTVNTRSDSTHGASALASQLPAVIISHGKNGYGAFQPNGIQVAGITAGTDEASNATLVGPPTIFYSRNPTSVASGCSDTAAGLPFCEFDDIVVMISVPTLVARIVSAGKLP